MLATAASSLNWPEACVIIGMFAFCGFILWIGTR